MMQRRLFAGLFFALLSSPVWAQAQESSLSMSSGERAVLKANVQDLAKSLVSGPKAPYFGTTGACDGSGVSGTIGNLTSGTISPAIFPNTTATMGVAVKMTARDKIQIKSTIQCNTDGVTSLASKISIVDKNGNVFFADPDTSAGFFPFTCNVNTSFEQHTGVWWFNAAEHAGSFAPGFTSIFRLDTITNAGGSIGFRSLCVDKVK